MCFQKGKLTQDPILGNNCRGIDFLNAFLHLNSAGKSFPIMGYDPIQFDM